MTTDTSPLPARSRKRRPNPLGPRMLLISECAEFLCMTDTEFRERFVNERRVKVCQASPRKTLISRADFERMLEKHSIPAVWESNKRRKAS